MSLDDMLAYLIPRGFPTFDEFKRNPDKYKIGGEQMLASVDRSITNDPQKRKQLVKQRYFWRQDQELKSLEAVQKRAREEGFDPDKDIEMLPGVRLIDGTSAGGRVEIHVHFYPRFELQLMGAVVPNA